jgi:ribonucleoside-diphosphate reductase beta chain
MSDEPKEEDPVKELAAELEGADSLVGPVELFDRWEKQAWTTRELRMEQDRADWGSLGPFTLRELRLRLYQFFLGEAAVTKTLPALTLAAPTQAAQCFLATQSADEARHTIFFLRYLRAVDELEGNDVHALAEHWSITASASHSQFFDSELVRATEAVRIDPSDRGAWMAGITIYHLLTEAVLAIAGQRGIIRTARRVKRLPVLTRGALNIARDESRHIAFGMRTLRDGVHVGHGDVIAGVVCEQIPLLTAILVSPEQRLPQLVPGALRPFVDEVSAGWDSAFDALAKRLRLIGLGDVIGDADRLWRSGIRQALEDYHTRHGVAHPATALSERGANVPEVSVPIAGGNV